MNQLKLSLRLIPAENSDSVGAHRVFRYLIENALRLESGLTHPNPTQREHLAYDTSIAGAMLWLEDRSMLVRFPSAPQISYFAACHALKLIILDQAFCRGWELTAKVGNEDTSKRYTLPFGFLESRKFHLDPSGCNGTYLDDPTIGIDDIRVMRHDKLSIGGELTLRPGLLTKKAFVSHASTDAVSVSELSTFRRSLPSFTHYFTAISGRPVHEAFLTHRPLDRPKGSVGKPSQIEITREIFLQTCAPLKKGMFLSAVMAKIATVYKERGLANPSDQTIRKHLIDCGYYMPNNVWNHKKIRIDAENLVQP